MSSSSHNPTSSGLVAIYRHVLARCEAPGGSIAMARLAMNIRRHCEPPTGNCPMAAAAYRFGVLSYFEQEIYQSYLDIMSPRAVFHAAAVGSGQGCILLPAESGCSKTTLAGLLIQRGMDYLGDELVCVDQEGQARTSNHLTKALTIKRGSFEVFSDVTPCASFTNAGEEIRYIDPEHLRAGSVFGDPMAIVCVIFPRFVAGSVPTIEPLTKGETILGLNASSVSTGLDVDFLIELSRRARGYRLEYGNVEEAWEAVFDVAQPKEKIAL